MVRTFRLVSESWCLLFLLFLPRPALAGSLPSATGLTVAQFDQLLASLQIQSDRRSSRRISGLRLTERVSLARLAQWEGEFRGNRSRQALVAIADAAAFLPPPADDVPSADPPERPEQEQILDRMMEYVKNTLPKLPNFSAQRSTTSFVATTQEGLQSLQQDSQFFKKRPQNGYFHRDLGPAQSSGLGYGELFWLGALNQTVTYRGGTEVTDVSTETATHLDHLFSGLSTAGEFGPVLEIVLIDAPRDKIVWDHWEKGANGSLAVFRYAVPEERAHFAINASRDHPPEFPAYHGEVTVDPSTGEVFRITAEARLSEADSVQQDSISVEFGPAQIGGMNYICPLRGVAMTKTFDMYADLDAQPPPIPSYTAINDVVFTKYHVFRSNSRIITGLPVQ